MAADVTTIALEADATQIKSAKGALEDLVPAGDKAANSADKVKDAYDKLASSLKTLIGLFGAYKAAQYAHEAAILSARYETLGVVMQVVGKNAGYTASQMEFVAQQLMKTGISMVEARQQTTRLVQAQIDLADASKLARIAQDAAVIGNINSSEAFSRLVHGIQTAQTETLRGIGINVSMERAYESLAATLGKKTNQLSQMEKTQAVVNAVMKEGANIAGVYEAAMDTAGKQLNSMVRYYEDLKVKIGDVFNDVLTAYVMGLTERLKGANGQLDEMAKDRQIKEWAEGIAEVFVRMSNAINNAVLGVKAMSVQIGVVARNSEIASEGQSKLNALGMFPSRDARSAILEDVKKRQAEAQKIADDTLNSMAAEQDKFLNAWNKRQEAVRSKQSADIKAIADKERDYNEQFAMLTRSRQEGLLKEADYVKKVRDLTQQMYGDHHVYKDTPAKATPDKKGPTDPYVSLISTAEERISVLKQELDTNQKLTEADKLWAKAEADLNSGKLKLNATQLIAYAQSLDTLAALEKQQAARKADIENQQGQAQATDALLKVQAESEALQTKFFMTNAETLKQIRDETDLLRLEIPLQNSLGMSNAELAARQKEFNNQREISIALRKLQIEYDQASIPIEGELTEAYEKRVAAVKKLYDEQARALPEAIRARNDIREQIDAAKRVEDTYRSMWESIDRTAHDTFVNIFQQGGGIMKRLADTIKATLLDALYQITVKKWVFQIFANVTGGAAGVAGLAANSSPGTGISAGGGLNLGSMGGLSSLLSLGSGLPSVGTALSNVSGAFSTFNTMIGEGAGLLESFKAATAGLGSSLTSLSPFIGAALQLVTGNVKGAALSAGGAILGNLVAPGIGGVIGGIAGNLLGGLFGGRSKEIPTVGLGGYGASWDASGTQLSGRGSQYGGDIESAHAFVTQAYKNFDKIAKGLGAIYDTFSLTYDTNSGKNSQNPQFYLSGGAGYKGTGAGFSQPGLETPLTQDAVDLAVSRVMLAGIQGSKLPSYLKEYFDKLTPASMSKAEIDSAIQSASALKFLRDVLASVTKTTGEAADELTILLGAIPNAGDLLNSYYQNYFSDAERLADATQKVQVQMASLGITMPETRAEFRKLVEAQDLNTDSGRRMYAALLQVAPAFASVTEAITDAVVATEDLAAKLAQQVSDSRQELIDALGEQISASSQAANTAREVANTYAGITKTLTNQILNLRQGALSPLLPSEKLSEAKDLFHSTAAKALAGDRDALDSLSEVSSQFLSVSRDFNASSSQYTSDFEEVMKTLDDARKISEQMQSDAERQLAVAQAQVVVLTDIKDIISKEGSIDRALLNQKIDLLASIGNASDLTLHEIIEAVSNPPDVVVLLRRLVLLNEQQVAAELKKAEDAANAQKEKDLIKQLNTTKAQQSSAIQSVNAGIEGINSLASQLGVQQLNASGGQAGQLYVDSSGRLQNIEQFQYLSGTEAAMNAFKTEFWKPGGLYEQTYGKSSSLGSLADLVSSLQSQIASLPGHAAGLPYVPSNDYVMRAHVGEAVIDADSMKSLRRYGIQAGGLTKEDADRIVDAVKEARDAILQASASSEAAIESQTKELTTATKQSTRDLRNSGGVPASSRRIR